MTDLLFDRRHFIGSSVAAAALLLAPAAFAAAIHTEADGLTVADVKVPVQGGDLPAYVAYPAKGGPFATVLVVQDLMGVTEQIKDVARRLAKLGYYAICPNLFSRQGDLSKVTDPMDIMRNVVNKMADVQILSDLDSTVAFAKKSGKANVDRMAITGFGWGGRVVWLYAAHAPKLRAGIAWYGFLTPPRDPAGHGAIALASTIKPPVLGLYAGNDDYVMGADIDQMKFALKGSKSDIVSFPGARHGFFADDQSSYDEKTAADGWNRMVIWLKTNGVV